MMTKFLGFRLTESERITVETAAARYGMSESEYLRRAALHAADCPQFRDSADSRPRGRGLRFWRRG